MIYDLIILGAGPAGITAAVYAARKKMNFLVISKDVVGPHPAAVYAAYLANALRPKTRFVSIIGSYGWGGKMIEQLSSIISNLKVEVIEPVLVKGYPKDNDLESLDRLAEAILKKHREQNISGKE